MTYRSVCYVFGAGKMYVDSPCPDLADGDYVIAVDGGFTSVGQLRLTADVLIGDFDSLCELPDHPNIIRLPQEKAVTDMMAALDYGLEKGYRIFRIFGGTGGRIDHTLANIQCLARLSQRGARGFLYEEHCVITAITDGSISFTEGCNGYVSVFAHGGEAAGVDITGLKYGLSAALLKNTFPLGTSNELTGLPGRISVEDGTIIVVYPIYAEVE